MRALNLGKARCLSLSCVVLSGVSRLPSPCFVAILISRVQPPTFKSLGLSCGTPCSCDTKSPDIYLVHLYCDFLCLLQV
jgi:hypothetical protein